VMDDGLIIFPDDVDAEFLRKYRRYSETGRRED